MVDDTHAEVHVIGARTDDDGRMTEVVRAVAGLCSPADGVRAVDGP